jgi:hypothetical protein
MGGSGTRHRKPSASLAQQDLGAPVYEAGGRTFESCGRRQSSTLRGGINTVTGRQSRIEVHPIIALRGASHINLFDVTPSFAKHKLFRRDRFTCAYCGLQFHERDLQREHIVPESLAARLPKGSRLG